MLRRRSLAAIIASAVFVSQVSAAAASTARLGSVSGGPAAAAIDKTLAKDLAAGRAHSIVVEFSAKADLRTASKVKGHAARGKAVLDALTATAASSQRDAKAVAAATKGVKATSYWLVNVMVVSGDPATLASLAPKLARASGVTAIKAEKIYPLVKPVDPKVAVLAAGSEPEWGVAKIGADKAWEDGILGQGVIVGSIDTGVDFTHPALVGNYRGNDHDGTFAHDYNWWDPAGECPEAAPCDDVFHGTHTMGTMVGGDGPGPFTPDIGVAPGAQWIAAKGCSFFGCSSSALLSSGQFILAPTNLDGEDPRPELRPDVVNNSWGGGPGDDFYEDIVAAWRAAGIIPVFSSGNPGSACGDGGSPGDFLNAFSVGATDIDDNIASFSGRGPSIFGKINPDVSAPGVDVVSSVPGGGYEAVSGTSMAAPHTSGTVALILSADQSLLGDVGNYTPVTDAIRSTAVDRIDMSCGGDDDGDPNNVYGDGRIDAEAAAALVASGGTLSGTVTEAGSGTPIGGVTVIVDNGNRQFHATTDASGDYEIFLAEGTYAVTFDAFGYFQLTVDPVSVTEDATTDQDAELALLPRFTVSGTVSSAESGSPIADVSVTAIATPVAPVMTDASGDYSLVLPIGEYTLRASGDGCTETGDADIISAGDDVDQDFSLFRKLDDFGHACTPIAADWVDVDGQTALIGDDVAGRLRLPFSFPFYGQSYDKVYVSSNGNVNFLEPNADFIPTSIPSPSDPNAAIYAFWADLLVSDEAGFLDSGVVGDAPNRAFVIEYTDVQPLGSETLFDFEIKLWENGTIDLVYGSNPPNPGDGRLATIGIENADGTDALQIGFLERVLRADSAIRITTVPTGFVGGIVTDANDGEPIEGATVTAEPGGRDAKTGPDGTYELRLRAGSYTVTAGAEGYGEASSPAVVIDDVTSPLDFSLEAPTAAVDVTEITETVDFGDAVHKTITLSNDGTRTLAWEAKEKTGDIIFPPLPEPTSKATYKPKWGHQPKPAGLTLVRPADTASFLFETIINDPLGDNEGSVDVGAVDGGSDGSNAMGIRLHYSDATPINEAVGFVLLDTDQDPETGLSPEELSGLPTQDVGVDFFLDLFFAPDGFVLVVDANTFDVTAEVPVTFDGQSQEILVPLEALGGDDGNINVATVNGDFEQPTDWAPDIGHGTIQPFGDATWLSEEPLDGSLEGGQDQAIEVTLGGPDTIPGEYHADLVLLTTAPRTPVIRIPVTFTVNLPDGFGAVTGTVSDVHNGEPVGGATVTAHAQWPAGTPRDFVATSAPDGTYKIVGPAGTWSTDYALDGWLTVSQDITIAAGVTTPGSDASLHRIQPHAVLDGDTEPVFIVLPGGTDSTNVTLSNPEGHADLTFTVHERPQGSTVAGEGSGLTATTTGVRSNQAAAAGTARAVTPHVSGEPSLVLMDTLPWGSDAIQQVLDANGVAFDEAGSADIASLDFAPYHAIYIGNDQPQEFYEELFANESKFTDFVENGGFLWFGAAAFGSQGSDLDGAVLPGGVTVHGPDYEDLNVVAAPDHPLMAGMPDPFAGNFSSHVTFSDLPADATVIARGAVSDEPTLVDYDLGAGHVVALGNPFEFGFENGLETALIIENGVPFAEDFTGFAEVPWLSESVAEGTIAPDGSTDIGISVDATGLEPGVYRAIVVIRTNDPDNASMPVRVMLIVPTWQQGIDSGSKDDFTAPNGTVYVADQEYSPAPEGLAAPGGPGPGGNGGGSTTFGYVGTSSANTTKDGIDGTDEDARYQSQREGATGYKFEVPDGVYQVDLSFAEFKAKKVGERVFGVAIEGEDVIDALDVFRLAGGRFVALDRTFVVTVSDGVLDIDFPMPKGHKSIINSILVTQLPSGAPGT